MNIKSCLLERFSENQHLALFAAPGSISIEIVDHEHIGTGFSNSRPILENLPPDLIDPVSQETLTIDATTFKRVPIAPFNAEVLSVNTNGRFLFNKLLYLTGHLEESISFWDTLGFRRTRTFETSATLEFKSFLTRATYVLHLYETSEFNQNPMLDDLGFPCTAFVSNSARKEKALFEKKGICTTQIETFQPDDKPLHIFFAKGQNGEFVEVIGIEK